MKLKAGVMVHEDWRNNVTREEFEDFQVTGHVQDLGNQIPKLPTVTSSSIRHQDVADILRIKTQNKDTPKKKETVIHTNIHNNMMVNEEFEFVVNVIMGQNAGSVLHHALRDEGVDNVKVLIEMTEDDIDSIKFRSPHSPGTLVVKSVSNSLKALLKTFRTFFYSRLNL